MLANEPPVATTFGGNLADPENWKLEHSITESPVISFSSGGYADLSFVRNASLPASIQVSYENGRLYAWEAKGTLIVFQ